MLTQFDLQYQMQAKSLYKLQDAQKTKTDVKIDIGSPPPSE